MVTSNPTDKSFEAIQDALRRSFSRKKSQLSFPQKHLGQICRPLTFAMCLSCGLTGETAPKFDSLEFASFFRTLWGGRIPKEGEFRPLDEKNRTPLLEKEELSEEQLAELPTHPRHMKDHLGQAVGYKGEPKGACPTCWVTWGYIELTPTDRHKNPMPKGKCAEVVLAVRCFKRIGEVGWPIGKLEDNGILFQRLKHCVNTTPN